MAIAAESFRDKELPRMCGTGCAVKALEAALWAFEWSTTFRDGTMVQVDIDVVAFVRLQPDVR